MKKENCQIKKLTEITHYYNISNGFVIVIHFRKKLQDRHIICEKLLEELVVCFIDVQIFMIKGEKRSLDLKGFLILN